MLEEKDYTKWHKVKTIEHNSSLGDNRGLNYREGQVYWASIGQNIGYEAFERNNRELRKISPPLAGWTRPILTNQIYSFILARPWSFVKGY